jgi:hypothetical protein
MDRELKPGTYLKTAFAEISGRNGVSLYCPDHIFARITDSIYGIYDNWNGLPVRPVGS